MAFNEPRLTDEEPGSIKDRLADPFEIEAVRWRVEERTPDGSKGKILAYVDPRRYADRLNQVLGPSGWDDNYSVKAIPGLIRPDPNGPVQAGKVFVHCQLFLKGLGTKPGLGESWADSENALARAESQSFRRACSRFGLGLYLYNLGKFWVRLDATGNPISVPELPSWAQPRAVRAPGSGSLATSHPRVRTFLDMRATNKIESFRSLLGDPIYLEILHRAGQSQSARAILSRNRQAEVLRWMEVAARRVNRVRTLTRLLGTAQLMAEMSTLQISSAASIPSLQALTLLLENMETIYGQRAA